MAQQAIRKAAPARKKVVTGPDYVLEEAIGFILRLANQRHVAIFSALMGDALTATQWAALSKLNEIGECTQNRLGRLTSMDAPTIKGVVERLAERGFLETRPDPEHGRRLIVFATAAGKAAYRRNVPLAQQISRQTLEPLSEPDRKKLRDLLARIT